MVTWRNNNRRVVETKIITQELGEALLKNEEAILPLVNAFSKDQNTMLDRVTAKKTIPGLRNYKWNRRYCGNFYRRSTAWQIG